MIESSKRSQELATFRHLAEVLRATKIGTIFALLPQIEGLQRRGHKTRAIWRSLSADGLDISYDLFRLYITRARRNAKKFGSSTVTARRRREKVSNRHNRRKRSIRWTHTNPGKLAPLNSLRPIHLQQFENLGLGKRKSNSTMTRSRL